MNLTERIAMARSRIDEYSSVCIMLSREHRGAFASSVVLAFDEICAAYPNSKPTVQQVGELMKASPELKGFAIPAWILIAVFSWLIQKILDYLWSIRQPVGYGDND